MAMSRTAGVLLLILLPLHLLPAVVRAQHFPTDDDLELMLRFIASDGRAPGLVFGILEEDGATRIVSYGTGGPGTPPLGERSIFEIGSITKAFTATLLAEMVLRGEVALDDPVARYLPPHVRMPSNAGREITLLHLATHTSGLPAMPDNLGPRNPYGIYPDYSLDDLYEFLTDHVLQGIPGSGYLYSNLNYGLLGHALALAAGTSFRELLRERVLDPLEMSDTEVADAADAPARLVQGYRRGEPAPYWHGTEAFQGAGALRSTAEDMLKFVRSNVGPPRTQLEQAMRMAHEMQVPRGGESGGGYGLAWTILAGDPTVLMHGGITVGFSSRVSLMPDAGVGTILLTNEIGFTFHHGGGGGLLFPLPDDRRWIEADVAAEVLARYAGRYRQVAGRGTYEVRMHDAGRLVLDSRGDEPTRLFATSDSTFFVLGAPMSLSFQMSEESEWMLIARERGGAGSEVMWTAVAGSRGVLGGWRPGGWALAIVLLMAVIGATWAWRSPAVRA